MMTCAEPDVNCCRSLSSGDLTPVNKCSADEDFCCPECRGPMTLFVWPILLCMCCFARRAEKQTQSGRNVLDQLEFAATLNQEQRRVKARSRRICKPCRELFDHRSCQGQGCECESMDHSPATPKNGAKP